MLMGQGDATGGPCGSGEYKVAQGECIFSIAAKSGLHWETIWNDPSNAELKQRRKAPEMLLPGDLVHVPDRQPGEVGVASGQRHRFRRSGGTHTARIRVFKDGKPRDGVRYRLRIGDRFEEGSIPGDGVIKVLVNASDKTGRLIVGDEPGSVTYELRFGHLDPPSEGAGAYQRLRNLGMVGGDVSDEETTRGVVRFQRKHGLPETGTVDKATEDKLVSEHGS